MRKFKTKKPEPDRAAMHLQEECGSRNEDHVSRRGKHGARRGKRAVPQSGEHGMQPEDGRPAPKRSASCALSGTANEKSVPQPIHPMGGAGNTITLRPVPLYLIPQTLSREIHTYKGAISRIGIRRSGMHSYLITIATQTPRGGPDAD